MENVFPKALNKNIFPFSCSEEMDDSVLPLDAYQKKSFKYFNCMKILLLEFKILKEEELSIKFKYLTREKYSWPNYYDQFYSKNHWPQFM